MKKFLLTVATIICLAACVLGLSVYANAAVAKVGSTEYETIDEAIAGWTNNTTLTLMSDVTLSDVIKLKSTEAHTLDLSTYTMTAASGKHAIEITCEGRTSASYALTVNADAENPGGITATGASCIYYNKSGSTKDRPIIRIYNGVFNGSYSINSKSNGNTNCPQIWIYGGTFNGNVNLTKNMLRVFGGTFNGWINCTGDSSAYREISGGSFKSWQFMTADAESKFWVGTSKGNYDVGVYVDDNGYLVVGGPVITEPGTQFVASSTNYGGFSSYLKYSSAATNQLYYTSLEEALADNNKANGNLTIYTSEIVLSAAYQGDFTLPTPESTLVLTVSEGETFPDVLAPAGKVAVFTESVSEGSLTRTYSVKTAYTVKHMQQNLTLDGYTLVETETLGGDTGAKTEAVAKDYEGFTALSFEQADIADDGSTVITIYYDRKSYTVTYTDNLAQDEIFADLEKSAVYGASAPAYDAGEFARVGYNFGGWYTDADCTDGNEFDPAAATVTGSITIYAKWIEKADVEITKTSFAYTWDGSAKAFEIVGTPQDGFTVLYTVDGTPTDQAPSAVGSYDVTVTRAEDGVYKAYENVFTAGLIIESATPVVTEPQKIDGLVYNTQPQALIVAGSSDNGSWEYSLDGAEYSADIPVGTDANSYHVVCRFVPSEGYAEIDDVSIQVAIAPMSVSAPSVVGSYVYTGEEQGVVLDGVEDYMITSGDLSATDAGDYTVSVEIGSNYVWNDGFNGIISWSIAKAQADIALSSEEDINVTYGTAVVLPTAETNFGEVVCDALASALVDAGSYTVTYTVNGTDNYYGDTKTVDVVIDKKEVTLVWSALTEDELVYDGAVNTLSVEVSGLVGEDECTADIELSGDNLNVGTFHYVATSLSNANYRLPDNAESTEYTITPATLTVTADSHKVFELSKVPELTYTVEGFIGEEGFITPPTCTTDANMGHFGVYTITPAGADAGNNYAITYVNGTLTVKMLPYTPVITQNVTVMPTIADGKISVSTMSFYRGAPVGLNVVPNVGYEIDEIEVVDTYGNVIPVSKTGDTSYTFTMPANNVTVNATFKAIEVKTEEPEAAEDTLPFKDVAMDDWFYSAIEYVYGKGLMIGNNAEGTLFDPDVTLNRAMLATVLYRIEGQPRVKFKGVFDDVPDGEWYSDAVEWAAKAEIVLGFGDGSFKPTEKLTREQAMAMLNRYAEYKGYKISANEDVSKAIISDWAVENVEWAVELGVIYLGKDGEIAGFDATADITRAEMAYALAQFSAEYID